jgi:4-coumarate--CoA ligase
LFPNHIIIAIVLKALVRRISNVIPEYTQEPAETFADLSPSPAAVQSNTMPYRSRWSLNPPTLSIPSFMFDTSTSKLDSTRKIITDAKRPEAHYLTAYTYREWAKRLAAGLRAAGLEQGDRVMLISTNSIFYPVVVMGTLMAGAIYNSANPAYTAREISHQLKDADPKFVLAAEGCFGRAIEAAQNVGFDSRRIFLFGAVPMDHEKGLSETTLRANPQHWGHLLAGPDVGKNFVWEERSTKEFSERTAILIYSSGTTGLPKGVELSHKSIIANMMQLKTLLMSDSTIHVRRSLCAVPMYHALGLGYYVFTAPKWAIETYLMERFNLADMLDHIQRFKMTELILVPPMLVAMAKHPSVRDGTCDISSIRKVLAGAAPIGMEVTQQFEELWHGRLKVRQAWGMSETPAITLCWDETDAFGSSSTSIGELVPGAEAKLVREDGSEESRPGQQGEFWIRSPNAMKGYWRNPKATSETFSSDGWLKTGDIAYRDEAGKWYMVDRKKVRFTTCLCFQGVDPSWKSCCWLTLTDFRNLSKSKAWPWRRPSLKHCFSNMTRLSTSPSLASKRKST